MGGKLFVYDGEFRSTVSDFAKAIGYSGVARKEINSWNDMKSAIKKYAKLDKLIVFTHGYPGGLMIGGKGKTLNDKSVAVLFKGVKTKIKEIELEGCWIGENPVAMAAFGRLFSARKVSGFTWTSITAYLTITLPKGVNTKELRKSLEPYAKWMLAPDYGRLAGLARRRDRKIKLLTHWYHPDGSHQPPYPSRGIGKKGYKTRSEATKRIVSASKAKVSTAPVTPFEYVTVTP